MPLSPGDLLAAKYRIETEIGRGAFGRVYRARDIALDRVVAIKELHKGEDDLGSTQFSDYVRRFEREARVQARFNHPNIVHVYELLRLADDRLYLVMEYVDGESLHDHLARRGPLPVDEALRIMLDLLAGLAAVHADERDIVHRDVKPSNVMLTKAGQAKLTDFGLAQMGDESMRSGAGQPHPGSPMYMSPEQETTSAYLYPASDMFSAGCVLFEMLTGKAYKQAKRRKKELTDLRPSTPEWLADVLALALARDTDERFADAEEMVQRIEADKRMATEAEAQAETIERARQAELKRRQEEEHRRAEAKTQAEIAERARQAELKRQQEEERRQAEAKAQAEAAERARQAELKRRQEEERRQAEAKAQAEAAERARQAEMKRRQEEVRRQAEEKAPAEAVQQARQAEKERRHKDLLLELAPGVTLDLVRVPAGEFLMGSKKAQDPQAYDDEVPQHRLHLPEYWIGKHPVTITQFAAFVKATGYRTTAEQRGSGWSWTGNKWEEIEGANWQNPLGPRSNVRDKADHPTRLVSWHDAVAFCKWASQTTGRVVQLPSEAEWEKAARGTDGRLYPWGNDTPTDKLCNFNMNVKDTTPVGRYSPRGDSPYDCVDMAGNVWEWTRSLWGEGSQKPDYSYPYNMLDGREDLNARTDARRVLRGGSFYNKERYLRCACRLYLPVDRGVGVGFRVASRSL